MVLVQAIADRGAPRAINRKMRAYATAIGLCAAAGAQGQEASLNLTAGLKAWQAQWTTWASDISATDSFDVITQVPAKDRFVLIPVIGLQYGRLVSTLSALPETAFQFRRADSTDIRQRRSELEATASYLVARRVSLGLGYKRFTQKGEGFIYEEAGPSVVGGFTAALRGTWSAYGNAAFGRLGPTGKSTVKVNADYRLTELGVAYSIPMGHFVQAISFTGGYRIQVLNARKLPIYDQNAIFAYLQDGRDLTQGFTFGVVASF